MFVATFYYLCCKCYRLLDVVYTGDAVIHDDTVQTASRNLGNVCGIFFAVNIFIKRFRYLWTRFCLRIKDVYLKQNNFQCFVLYSDKCLSSAFCNQCLLRFYQYLTVVFLRGLSDPRIYSHLILYFSILKNAK